MALFIAATIASTVGCGSSDDPPEEAAAGGAATTEKPKSILSITSADEFPNDESLSDDASGAVPVTAELVEVFVVPAVEPEAGSDEAAILEVFERQVRALNLRDWETFIDTCDPRLAKINDVETVESLSETFVFAYAPAPSYNRRNVEIKVFNGSAANVAAEWYSYDEPVLFDGATAVTTESWVKVDGDWYVSNVMCHSGNRKLK